MCTYGCEIPSHINLKLQVISINRPLTSIHIRCPHIFPCEICTHIHFESMQARDYHIDQVITIKFFLIEEVREGIFEHPHALKFTILIGYIYVQEIPFTYP